MVGEKNVINKQEVNFLFQNLINCLLSETKSSRKPQFV